MTTEQTTVFTFIVRIVRTESGLVHGVIERASTGVKQPVSNCDAVGPTIAAMLAAEEKELS